MNTNYDKGRPVGPYIVDFYCGAAKLALEIYGKQHRDDEIFKYDKKRSAKLKQMGIEVLRILNSDI